MSRPVCITYDSTCDLTPEMLEKILRAELMPDEETVQKKGLAGLIASLRTLKVKK